MHSIRARRMVPALLPHGMRCEVQWQHSRSCSPNAPQPACRVTCSSRSCCVVCTTHRINQAPTPLPHSPRATRPALQHTWLLPRSHHPSTIPHVTPYTSFKHHIRTVLYTPDCVPGRTCASPIPQHHFILHYRQHLDSNPITCLTCTNRQRQLGQPGATGAHSGGVGEG